MKVWSLGQEDPLEEGIATHFSIIIWRILWTEEAGGLQPTGLQRVGWQTDWEAGAAGRWKPTESLHCCYSVAQSCPILCNPMDYSTPGFPVHHHLPEFAQTLVHWVGDAIQLSRPLLSPSHPAFNLSQHQGLSSELALCNRWPKYWNFSFSISLSSEYSGLITFRIDQFDLLAVQGTRKSLLQHHSSKASIIQHSAFLLSSSYVCTWLLEKP